MEHQVPYLRADQTLEQGLVPNMALKPWLCQGEKESGETTHNLIWSKGDGYFFFHDTPEI